jgi:hypothetical protein
MIAYEKEPWEDVKKVLEALFYDWSIDLEGNLIVHWENFDIRNEKTGEIVDHVDHLWLKFIFKYGNSYEVKWWRSDKNAMKNSYMHPHINEEGRSYCSGGYPQGHSLCRDLHYLTTWIDKYNQGSAYGHAEISEFKPTVKVDKSRLQAHLQYTYFFNPVTGIPDIKTVELHGIAQDEVIQETELPKLTPTHYFWKDQLIERRWNKPTTSIHSINLKDYSDDKHLKSVIATYNRTRIAQTDTQVS